MMQAQRGRTGRRSWRRSATVQAVGLVAAGLLAAALVAPGQANGAAGAAESQGRPAPTAERSSAKAYAGLSDDLRAQATRTGQTARQAATTYWTQARMKAATPQPGSRFSSADLKAAAAAGPDGAAGRTATSAAPKGNRPTVNASATVGRVFFYNPVDKKNHSCSGSALNSTSKRLVITAGHCVFASGQYMQNWVFVPYYNYGNRPYGTFAARTYRTFDAWRNSASKQHDIAMVTTWTNEQGYLLVNRVGGNGLAWNWSKSIYLTILAYPADPPYDGTWQQYCRGTTRQVSSSDGRIQLKCAFTGGSSGGPWFKDYSDSTTLGYVDGVMSTLQKSTGWNRSSYFDSKVKTMFDATVND